MNTIISEIEQTRTNLHLEHTNPVLDRLFLRLPFFIIKHSTKPKIIIEDEQNKKINLNFRQCAGVLNQTEPKIQRQMYEEYETEEELK